VIEKISNIFDFRPKMLSGLPTLFRATKIKNHFVSSVLETTYKPSAQNLSDNHAQSIEWYSTRSFFPEHTANRT
jgi:hypothetical protein